MFTFIFSFFLSSFAHGADSARIQKMSEDSQWLRLLSYHSSIWNGPKSLVRSDDFFLSSEGKNNPEAELIATIVGMSAPISPDPNKHAQCRFPARKIWLQKMMPPEAARWPVVNCPDFFQFSMQGRIHSVSLIFASGYLSNPASFFGHPLIKFNSSKAQRGTALLDQAVNYGAITPNFENPFIYAAKGLSGAYDSTFSHRNFYSAHHAYGEVELRDLWEYELNLPQDQVSFFVANTWEVLGRFFPYYFFTENCASAINRLVENSTGLQLISPWSPYALPLNVFQNLTKQRRTDGEPLVRSIHLIPSRQSRLAAGFHRLESQQKELVKHVAQTNQIPESLGSLEPGKKAEVIETLLNYYSVRSIADRNDRSSNEKPFAEIRRDLLLQRLQLPAASQTTEAEIQKRSPDEAPKPLLLRVGGVQSLRYGGGAEVQFRMASADLLSLEAGRARNSEVRVLDGTIETYDRSVWFRRLDLISVMTLNISETGLPGDGGLAWSFTTGFDSLNLSCHDCTLYKIEGGAGKATTLFDRQTLFAMIEGRAQTPTNGSGSFAATPKIGLLLDFFASGTLKAELSLGYRSYLDRKEADGPLSKIETRWGLSQDWDLRLSYEKHFDERTRISYSKYW